MNSKRKFSIPTLILIIIILPVLFFNIMIIYKANRYPDKVPDFMGYKPFAVLSGSMQSNIMKGDLVVVKEVDTTTLAKNDIIAYRTEDDSVVTHRIIEVINENGKTYFVTKGDNNNVEDDKLVGESSVEGKYVFRISGLGDFIVFVQQPLGFCVFMLSLFIIGMIIFAIMNRRENKEINKANEQYMKEFEEFKRNKEKNLKK